MGPENVTEFLDDLAFQVRNNIIPMSRIDDAVKRILRVKFVMGLFENPLADLSLANQLGSQVISPFTKVIMTSLSKRMRDNLCQNHKFPFWNVNFLHLDLSTLT